MPSTNVDQFLTDPSSIACVCGNSTFKNSYHDHIVTGDPGIIKHNKIRNFFTKSPNYPEPRKINNDQQGKILLMILKTVFQHRVKNMENQMLYCQNERISRWN